MKLIITLCCLSAVLLSCNNYLGRLTLKNGSRMSFLIQDSTGYSNQSMGIMAVPSATKTHFMFAIRVQQDRDPATLLGISERIDQLLHQQYPFLQKFEYRYYTFNSYVPGKNGYDKPDTTYFSMLKVKNSTVTEVRPPDQRINERYKTWIDSILRVGTR